MTNSSEPKFITEDYLRQHFGLAHGSEIQLMPGCRFTPAANSLLNDRNITVRWRDEKGQMFIAEKRPVSDNESADVLVKVHPLKSNNIRPTNGCLLCGSEVADKPALMTHLNDTLLVPKTHPRIELRGKLDSCISYCVVVQTQLEESPNMLQGFVADIRSYLGRVLQAEVTEQALELPRLGDFCADTIHQWSHYPLKYLGHDHMLPDVSYGPLVAQLNYLRALVRELELIASRVFLDASMQLSRPDIIAGLNRLSSSVYVVMILIWQCQNGKQSLLGELHHGTA
jgi:ethanolamine utilization cobalamin adenosyltransferase